MLTILYKLWRYGAFTWNEMRPSEIVQRVVLMGAYTVVKVKLLSHIRLFATPWTVAYQAPLSMGFSRQQYWSGLPFPSPGDLPNQGSNRGLLHGRQTLYRLSHQESPLQQCTFHLDWIAKNSEMYRYSVISQNYSEGWDSILGVSDSKTHLS